MSLYAWSFLALVRLHSQKLWFLIHAWHQYADVVWRTVVHRKGMVF